MLFFQNNTVRGVNNSSLQNKPIKYMSFILFWLGLILFGAACEVDSARKILRHECFLTPFVKKISNEAMRELLFISTATTEVYIINIIRNIFFWPFSLILWINLSIRILCDKISKLRKQR